MFFCTNFGCFCNFEAIHGLQEAQFVHAMTLSILIARLDLVIA